MNYCKKEMAYRCDTEAEYAVLKAHFDAHPLNQEWTRTDDDQNRKIVFTSDVLVEIPQ